MSQIALNTESVSPRSRVSTTLQTLTGASRYLIPVARVLSSVIFIKAGFGHFSKDAIDFAAAQGVPLAGIAVPLSGVASLVGGISILLGYHTKLGAALLFLFLVVVTLAIHPFWSMTDPMEVEMHRVMFMKNLGLIGGVLLLAHVGAGPFSLDARRGRTP